MNRDLIHSRFGIPMSTLAKWEKTRPDYYRYLSKAPKLLDLLPAAEVDDIMALTKTKAINDRLGVEGTFAKSEMRITASTVSAWMTSEKTPLYVALVAGAIFDNLEPHLERAGKTLDDIVGSGHNIIDIVFVWRHRPSIFPVLLNGL